MIMRKITYIFCTAIALLGGIDGVKAQQDAQLSQYMWNPYILNPAVAGTLGNYQVRFNSRFQWTGINDAPQTYQICAYGPDVRRRMGWGAQLYSDIVGPISTTGFLASYGYNVQLNEMFSLSGGLSLGGLQYKLDGTKLDAGDLNSHPELIDLWNNDPSLLKSTISAFAPDASFGLYLYATNMHVGFSVQHLFGSKLNFNNETIGINRLRQSIYLTGGYIFPINRELSLEPTLLAKFMSGAPLVPEVNCKAKYRVEYRRVESEVWGGISFRYGDAAALMFGIVYEKKYLFGYSFDWSYTQLGRYTNGTHEVMIGVLFDKIK
jgi:type IX secretion system PorP/SprF family membrane protein